MKRVAQQEQEESRQQDHIAGKGVLGTRIHITVFAPRVVISCTPDLGGCESLINEK